MGGGVLRWPLNATMVPCAPSALRARPLRPSEAGTGAVATGAGLVATGMTTNRYSRGARASPNAGLQAAGRTEKVQGARRRTQALQPTDRCHYCSVHTRLTMAESTWQPSARGTAA